MKLLTLILFSLSLLSCSPDQRIRIEWVEELQGDFSFTKEWNYPEGIYLSESGQLVCDGLCPSEIEKMRDEKGVIYPDSIARYYKLVDTAHYFHTILSEAHCYEWIGTDFAHAYRGKNDTVQCYTECNAATHSSLQLTIIGNRCIPRIELNSISAFGLQYFDCSGGYIRIDKALFREGILKADFDLTFDDIQHPQQPLWWKGRIYTPIMNNNKSI